MPPPRRSNAERTHAMRERLLTAARRLFVADGFHGASTPALVAEAAVTRGALYHHFPDKAALFRAVVGREAAAVAEAVQTAGERQHAPLDRLKRIARASLAAMAEPGRTRLLLVEAPSVLGVAGARAVAQAWENQLARHLDALTGDAPDRRIPVEPATALLAATLERAAVDADGDPSPSDALAVIDRLLTGLATPDVASKASRPRGRLETGRMALQGPAGDAPDLFSFLVADTTATAAAQRSADP